jgi:hypothetical protein
METNLSKRHANERVEEGEMTGESVEGAAG